VIVKERLGPFPGRLDVELLQRWAVATADPSIQAQAGLVAPAVSIVTQVWAAQEAARQDRPWQVLEQAARGGVHGAHDIVLQRPIAPGEQLQTSVEGHGSRTAGVNAAVTLRYVTTDVGGAVVAEQWWTTVLLGVTCDEVGERAPDHAFPEGARDRLIGVRTVSVDGEMTRRYAAVSGDWSPHHFEVEAAHRSGFERPFLHGLCTMALCAQSVVAIVAPDEAARVRRVALRFAAPMPVGEELRVEVFAAGELSYAFEASAAGATIVTQGRVELA
jgi:acyl dehydratase